MHLCPITPLLCKRLLDKALAVLEVCCKMLHLAASRVFAAVERFGPCLYIKSVCCLLNVVGMIEKRDARAAEHRPDVKLRRLIANKSGSVSPTRRLSPTRSPSRLDRLDRDAHWKAYELKGFMENSNPAPICTTAPDVWACRQHNAQGSLCFICSSSHPSRAS